YETYNPAKGEKIATVAKANEEDAERAVQAARKAFEHGKWRKYPVGKRSRVMNNIAQVMRERFKDLVEMEVLNSGKSVGAAQVQMNQAIKDFDYYAWAIVVHRAIINIMP